MSISPKSQNTFQPFLSPLMVTAFAIGTSMGWGSLVVTSNTYLKQAGPLGSAIGILLGGLVMLTYFTLYGTDRVRSVCFNAAAVYGETYTGELMTGDLQISSDALAG